MPSAPPTSSLLGFPISSHFDLYQCLGSSVWLYGHGFWWQQRRRLEQLPRRFWMCQARHVHLSSGHESPLPICPMASALSLCTDSSSLASHLFAHQLFDDIPQSETVIRWKNNYKTKLYLRRRVYASCCWQCRLDTVLTANEDLDLTKSEMIAPPHIFVIFYASNSKLEEEEEDVLVCFVLFELSPK